jgi:hypothetical protein
MLLLVGCTPASIAPPTVVVEARVEPAPSATASAWSAPAGPPATTPPEVEAPGSLGCLLTTRRHHALRFRPNAPPFAWIGEVSATVDLTTLGPAAGAVARITHGGFTIQGLVAADDLVIVPARAIAVGGFLVPTAETRLAWKATAPNSITVAVPTDAETEPAPDAHLDAVGLACDAVALDPAGFDARTAAPRSVNERNGVLRSGRPVSLSLTPGGKPIATWHIALAEDAGVAVVAARAGSMLVRREQQKSIQFGWVRAADVTIVPDRDISESFSNGDYIVDPWQPPPVRAVVTCPRPLALVAAAGGERRTVGSVAVGTRLSLREAAGDLVPVALPEKLVAEDREATVGVLASHLQGCTPQ